ncbi:MAG: glycine zipper 2TM domain-containing protein [Micavibrio sp.]
MSLAKKFGAAAIAAAAVLGTSGCATMDMGMPTMAGGALGGAAGRAISDSPLGVIGGAIIGGVIGNQFEPDCRTQYNSSINRSVNGNSTGQWRGGESMQTRCNYSGKNPPANLNAPQHLQHLQERPRATPWR